jgi:alpha-beta hydrolase superfamily lysophospholipase
VYHLKVLRDHEHYQSFNYSTLLCKNVLAPIKMATIVFVPGSFAPADIYTEFVEVLTKHGLETVVVNTPSVGRREGKGPATMTDDVDEISNVVVPLIDQGKEVILVAHSYGGIPTTQSLEKLSQKARSAEGKSGGVKKVVYLTAVILQVGSSNFELFGENMPDFVSVRVSSFSS